MSLEEIRRLRHITRKTKKYRKIEERELGNLIDCLSFVWPFTLPLCNMVLLSTFVMNYMHAFA